ncbi:unnamed protein product, partial [marine sediment metagenome]
FGCEKIPYFNKNLTEKGVKFPDMDWIEQNVGSISKDSYKVMMQLRKVTPLYLTDILRDVFYKILNNTEVITQTSTKRILSFFPTSQFMNPKLVGYNNGIKNVTSLEALSIAKYNDIGLCALDVIRTLIDAGLISTNKVIVNQSLNFSEANISEDEKRKRKRMFLEYIASLIGFYDRDWTEKFFKENPNELTLKQNVIKKILYRYFHPYTNKKIQTQNITELKVLKHNDAFVNALIEGAKNGQHVINKLMLLRTRNIVGQITRGGEPGRVVDGDFRGTHLW